MKFCSSVPEGKNFNAVNIASKFAVSYYPASKYVIISFVLFIVIRIRFIILFLSSSSRLINYHLFVSFKEWVINAVGTFDNQSLLHIYP